MKAIDYLKNNGIKRAVSVLWNYKIEIIIEKIVLIFTKNKPLKDIILIESHNDFDSNGGAFYDYLIRNKYNEKYKIVWLVRTKNNIGKLPYNVTFVPLLGPSLRKAYYVCIAKYGTFDCDAYGKRREDQIIVYCSHGTMKLKKIKGKTNIPSYVNYILVPSKKYTPLILDQYELKKDDNRAVCIGFPCHDVLYSNDKEEIKKITDKKYEKIVLWMPTFRKGVAHNRNDSDKEQKLGIPLFETIEQYNNLNDCLARKNVLLIIKIHPKQDLSNLKISNMSNIIVLCADDVKKLKVDNYHLLNCVDALISDYSSIAFDFLHVNKPIGYVLDDIDDYKIGFCVDNVDDFLAGAKIYNFDEFNKFIENVIDGYDEYKDKREKLRDDIYDFHDGNSSKRLSQLMGLDK